MISINKLSLGIVSFLIFMLLLNITFIKKERYINIKEIEYKLEQNQHFLNIENDEIIYNSSGSINDLNLKYLNQFDKIIYLNGDLSIENKSNIEIKKGFFLFHISELNNNYQIKGEGFKIDTKGPGFFIIDNSGLRTTIFSINSIINLDLINIENDKIVNNVNLYPNKYIKIIPNQNKNIENADLLRLTQRFTLDYFNEKLLLNGNINKSFLEKVIGEKDEVEINKIKKILLFIDKNEELNTKTLTNLKNIKIGFLLSEKLIKQYHILFVNDNKKTIYYKNLIISTLGEIINNGYNKGKGDLLINTLNELKIINNEEYTNIIQIIDYYFYAYTNSYNNSYKEKMNLSLLYSKIKGNDYNFNDEELLELNILYFKYNFRNYEKLYSDLNYITYKIGNSLKNENKRSYFIFFLNKLILSGFNDLDENKKISFEDIIGLFNIYGNNSINYYSINDNTRITTGIVEYNNILGKLVNQIRISYFQKELNKQGLLVINSINNLGTEKINALESNMIKIIEYYNKNKGVLSNRGKDELIKNQFDESKLKYEEYILALKDYQTYVANYNEQNKKLLFGETANNSNKDENVISIENANKFLRQFNYLDFSYLKISLRGVNYCNNPSVKYDLDGIEEPYCYKIENLIVGSGLYLDMILSPRENNNIYNFVINSDKNKNKGSYKLDIEKVIWDDNYSKTTINNEKFKFENFFLYVFNPPKEISNEIVTIVDEKDKNIEESIVVRIFKMNKLLGDKGDFNILKGFLNIKYEDTIVEENNEDFNIYIKNSLLEYEKGQVFYKGFLSGEYQFLAGHNFINPNIRFVNKINGELYFGNIIKFEGTFNINTIKDELLNIFGNLNNLNNILINLEAKNGIKKYDIVYKKSDDSFYIKNIENRIEVILKGISITGLTYNGVPLINKPIPVFNIRTTLDLIK